MGSINNQLDNISLEAEDTHVTFKLDYKLKPPSQKRSKDNNILQNERLSNMNPIKTEILIHLWHLLHVSCMYNVNDKINLKRLR